MPSNAESGLGLLSRKIELFLKFARLFVFNYYSLVLLWSRLVLLLTEINKIDGVKMFRGTFRETLINRVCKLGNFNIIGQHFFLFLLFFSGTVSG